jgi:hypothetical protein
VTYRGGVNLICGGINQRRVNQGAHATDWKQREPELLRDRWRLREPPLVRALAIGREPEEEALSG